MSLTDKKLVQGFYTSHFYKDPEEVQLFLHPEVELYWNSSAGFNKMNFEDVMSMSAEMSMTFESMRAEISHLLYDKNKVTIRFTYHIKTLENPEEEIPVAHFIAIWEIKDGKMFKGYQISQAADETPENLSSFISTNF